MNALETARTVVDILEEKKGENILLLDIQEISDFTNYFVICSGSSDRMVNALADDVSKQMRNRHQVRGRSEGEPHDGWILLDYGHVIVHIFAQDRRDYYRLEELWGDGKVLLNLQ